MRIGRRNALDKLGLGIRSIEFARQKGLLAIWRVIMVDGEVFEVETPGLGTETTVIKLAAQKLRDRAVKYIA